MLTGACSTTVNLPFKGLVVSLWGQKLLTQKLAIEAEEGSATCVVCPRAESKSAIAARDISIAD